MPRMPLENKTWHQSGVGFRRSGSAVPDFAVSIKEGGGGVEMLSALCLRLASGTSLPWYCRRCMIGLVPILVSSVFSCNISRSRRERNLPVEVHPLSPSTAMRKNKKKIEIPLVYVTFLSKKWSCWNLWQAVEVSCLAFRARP
jgi:hypothetical protein